jgi:CheY-like chemotaxis protein
MDPSDRHRPDASGGRTRASWRDEVAGGGTRDDHGLLLVEDNPGDVALFLEAVEESDVRGEVTVATSGDDALAVIRGDDGSTPGAAVDLVVLDLDLPGRSGLAVLEELKMDPETRAIPVVILSASRDRAMVRRAYDLGANAYLVKRASFADTVGLVDALQTFWFDVAELPE